jgi:short-subunit dehydrogenase
MIAYIHPPLLASYAASKAGVAAMTDAIRLEMRAVSVTVGTVHPVIFRTPMISNALSSPAAAELVNDFTGAFKTVELQTVVDAIVRGIEHRAKRTIIPRQHAPTALSPGLAEAAIERLLFRPRSIDRAIRLGSEPTPGPPTPPSTTGQST